MSDDFDINYTPDPKPSSPLTWQEIWTFVITRPDVKTFETILNAPDAKAERAFRWMFIMGMLGSFINGMQLLRAGLMDLSGLFFMLLMGGPAVLLVFAILVAAYQFVAKQLGGKGKYSEFAYAYGAILAPFVVISAVASIIPLPIFLRQLVVIGLGGYQLVLTAIALKAVNRFSTNSSAATVAIVFFMMAFAIACMLSSLGSQEMANMYGGF